MEKKYIFELVASDRVAASGGNVRKTSHPLVSM